jgi:hypothetical protein
VGNVGSLENSGDPTPFPPPNKNKLNRNPSDIQSICFVANIVADIWHDRWLEFNTIFFLFNLECITHRLCTNAQATRKQQQKNMIAWGKFYLKLNNEKSIFFLGKIQLFIFIIIFVEMWIWWELNRTILGTIVRSISCNFRSLRTFLNKILVFSISINYGIFSMGKLWRALLFQLFNCINILNIFPSGSLIEIKCWKYFKNFTLSRTV